MYAGHKSEDGRVQPLDEHLRNVAELSRKFADSFGAADVGHILGLCHDIGKYSNEFQNRILHDKAKVDHSTAGGLEAEKHCGPIGAYCVFGHHGGLADGGTIADTSGESSMYGRMKRRPGFDIPDYSDFQKEIILQQPKEPDFKVLGNVGFSYSMLIRMLFSCLVDADFLDTAWFMSDGKIKYGEYDNFTTLYGKLLNYIQPFQKPTSTINQKRCEILNNCIAKATQEKGLYSLTVPTGGGKTISSLAFALNHIINHSMKRVIYVIPYTSIIEQNAAVFAKILGKENVLEHHSNFDYGNESYQEVENKLYLSTENWDAPVIVTTNVQFFESIFSSKTSKCRKLHNIANSVIIFDEAQMLPMPYLKACVRGIAELVHNFGCTAVLCSATQPALDNFFPEEIKRREICSSPTELYNFFKRTTVKNVGSLTDEQLSKHLDEYSQVLCIVNTRKQAQNVFELLNSEGNYHLSTLMYPEHRKKILNEIRERLKMGQECRVISTSLIEAGVDVDFPVVFRARTGLDSIIQAAGRCNREGKRTAEESKVYVFEPSENYSLPVVMRQPVEVFNMIESNYCEDISSLQAIRTYFEKLYEVKAEALDAKAIVSRFEDGYKKGASFPFRTVDKEFKLIENDTYSILIPNNPRGEELLNQLKSGKRNRSILREVGCYCVNVYANHYELLKQMGIIEDLDSELSYLVEMGSYNDKTGLALEPEGGKAIFVEI